MQQLSTQIRRVEQDGLFRATTAGALFNFHFLNSTLKYFQASPDRMKCRKWISLSAILGHVHLG
jgi:hypothetical protein